MKKIIFAIAIIAVMSVAGILTVHNIKEKPLIDVGIVGLMSFGSTVGFTQHQNAMFFLEEHPNTLIRPVAIDDKLNPALSAQVVKEAMNRGIRFFITSHPSSCSEAIMDLFTDSRALMLVTASATPLLTGRDDYVLRVIDDTEQEQKRIAHLVNKMPGNRLLVLQDDGNLPYTDPAFKYFSKELDSIGKWEIVNLKLTVSNFDPGKIESLIKGDFDLLYILAGSYQKTIGNLAQLFHKVNKDAPIVLTPWAWSRGIIEAAGPAASRIVNSNFFQLNSRKESTQEYIRRLDSRFGQITPVISIGVRNALELLDQAFSKGYTTPDAVKNYLLTAGTHQTSLGSVSFDRFGDLILGFNAYEIKENREN